MSARSSLNFPNNLTQIPINISAANATFIPGAAGKEIKVFRMKLIVFDATILEFLDGTAVLDVLDFPGPGTIVLDFSSIDMPPWYETSIGNDLVLTNSASVVVSGNVDYLLS